MSLFSSLTSCIQRPPREVSGGGPNWKTTYSADYGRLSERHGTDNRGFEACRGPSNGRGSGWRPLGTERIEVHHQRTMSPSYADVVSSDSSGRSLCDSTIKIHVGVQHRSVSECELDMAMEVTEESQLNLSQENEKGSKDESQNGGVDGREFPHSSSRNESNSRVKRKYIKITEDLAKRLDKNSNNVALFFVEKGETDCSTQRKDDPPFWALSSSLFVKLPWGSSERICKGLRWERVEKNLRNLKAFCRNVEKDSRQRYKIVSCLKKAVQDYCDELGVSQSNFEILSRRDINFELEQLIPFIVDFALELPTLLACQIPVLKSGQSKTLFLTKKLCCSLLANAFLCTFPRDYYTIDRSRPDVNFFRLFHDTKDGRAQVKAAKVNCILNYFSFVGGDERWNLMEDKLISFERRCMRKTADWEGSQQELIEVKVDPHGKIEDAHGLLQVDFANKLVGGGVLNDGSVMEEIRFCVSPELIVARIFTEALEDNEALIVTGISQFSRYSGYGPTFRFRESSPEFENFETDNIGRLFTQVVAMDAIHFHPREPFVQFYPSAIQRELHKCFVAFQHGPNSTKAVATGNWGCGVFNGNPELKFFIQLMAASEVGREGVVYHTGGDKELTATLMKMENLFRKQNVTVGILYKILMEYQHVVVDRTTVARFVVRKIRESNL